MMGKCGEVEIPSEDEYHGEETETARGLGKLRINSNISIRP